jgi:5-oxopent-3-ene-1,2,5-tricarboxylate decarboxylase/2-hydroxyhepta-2,4-diene-1,7-dioate isomerase
MQWDMHYLVADLARTITLLPGDLILSGTPANSRPVYPGDVVTVEVEGLGKLTNRIVAGPTPIRTDVGAQPSRSEEVLSTAQGGDWEFRGIRAPRGPGAQHYASTVAAATAAPATDPSSCTGSAPPAAQNQYKNRDEEGSPA